ncbi:MAG: sugar ABC transporter permease [Clostridia bacterium]|nr:sugar ABC transporter permease [Clostridia bacterium]MBQ9289696.1 sugar ABC transporter permease [Clostridia bacterium]MBR0217195.1 sugar ABC transporter permease [Clostridia bacterium]
MRTKKSTPYLFLAPYLILFLIFIIIPTIMAVGLSFTNYNAVQAPQFVGLTNYINLLTQDTIFLQYVLPNTILFSVIVGPLGYLLAFFLAWSLSQLTRVPRTILALIIYSPSMTMGVAMTVMWRVVFLGDQSGIANYVLTQLGVITEPIVWMLNTQYILPIVIIVALWSSMGVGFLAMLAGLLNINAELYEAGAIDGIKNRIQEVFYITIPSMKPQMLFGAVMSIVGAFQAGNIGVMLTGSNPTPGYAAQLMVNHIDDYGFTRYEMGYAAAVSVALLGLIYAFSFVARKLFAPKDE